MFHASAGLVAVHCLCLVNALVRFVRLLVDVVEDR